ncbi:hypothetical protein KK083_12075 [Fulvivirgaceae bacterium PWU4]|uniref:T9SS C-terminal target domain-containing protein n=1 Tax=Chryseosolibacter histidini TaxID=2782349 RepID=A0AAP2DP06_9BACT|nr:hypothetical protein [Chryseosolibacter histidini]MBT1697619.1 hypothetical protein [Chryseosolibacter histidini]
MINRSFLLGLLLVASSGQLMAQEDEKSTGNTSRPSISRKLGLAQNTPDPVSHNEHTMIRYSAIDAYERYIFVNDEAGNRVMTFNDLKDEGEIKIDASRLAPGTYRYALVVNGRVVERRKMVVK